MAKYFAVQEVMFNKIHWVIYRKKWLNLFSDQVEIHEAMSATQVASVVRRLKELNQ
jgi:hypothetical protein